MIPSSDALETIQKRCSEEVTADSHYQALQNLGLEFGPSLHGVQHVWRQSAGGEALGQISLPEIVSAEAASYVIHPALLDACLQIVAEALPFQDHTEIYMPLSLDNIQVYGQVGNQLWSHATIDHGKTTERQEIYNASVRLLDDSGQVVAEIEGIHLKRASKAALMKLASQTANITDWLYQVKWQPSLTRNKSICGLFCDAFRNRIASTTIHFHIHAAGWDGGVSGTGASVESV